MSTIRLGASPISRPARLISKSTPKKKRTLFWMPKEYSIEKRESLDSIKLPKWPTLRPSMRNLSEVFWDLHLKNHPWTFLQHKKSKEIDPPQLCQSQARKWVQSTYPKAVSWPLDAWAVKWICCKSQRATAQLLLANPSPEKTWTQTSWKMNKIKSKSRRTRWSKKECPLSKVGFPSK